MEKENIIKLIQDITWTDDDSVDNVEHDSMPNEAFDAGAAWMKKKIIEELSLKS